MKKIYQNPEIKIVKIQPALMQTTSLGYSTTQTTTETSGNLSRGGSFWDDDDEDY